MVARLGMGLAGGAHLAHRCRALGKERADRVRRLVGGFCHAVLDMLRLLLRRDGCCPIFSDGLIGRDIGGIGKERRQDAGRLRCGCRGGRGRCLGCGLGALVDIVCMLHGLLAIHVHSHRTYAWCACG